MEGWNGGLFNKHTLIEYCKVYSLRQPAWLFLKTPTYIKCEFLGILENYILKTKYSVIINHYVIFSNSDHA